MEILRLVCSISAYTIQSKPGLKRKKNGGSRDCLGVKSTGCSSIRPGFNSQHHISAQNHILEIRWLFLAVVVTRYVHGAQITN